MDLAQAAEDAFRADHKAFHPLRVSRVIQETHDTRSIALAVPPELSAAFRYQAGQFLTFKVPFGGAELTRCYSLSSSPEVDSEHRVTVKRVPDGRISNWFNDRLEVGDTLSVLPPAGRFVLRDRTTPLLLFGAGSGVTPVFSILKTALATTTRSVRLVYANRDDQSVIFQRDLRELSRAYPGRFELVQHLDAQQGLITGARVAELCQGSLDADCYICGPAPFMDLVEHTLASLALPREHIFVERFVSPADPEQARATREAAARAPHNAPSHIRARWDGKLHLVPYAAGQTLLQAAVAAGIDPPYSCEEGYCSSCQARLTSGRVTMAVNDCLSDEEVQSGCILACQAYPDSDDIEIDWDA